MYPIIFPNLGLSFNINNIALSIFNLKIYWYAIIIITGIIVCLLLMRLDKNKYEIKYNDVIDFLSYALIAGIICARIYYVIFRWSYYKDDPLSIFKIWNGGIAIYGGIIGALITAYIFCKKRKINVLNFCDYCAPYLALAQSIGRWGNFINQEAYGSETNSFLKMGIYDYAVR